GGTNLHYVYVPSHAAVNNKGQPTVILAKTVKGYGMGRAAEAKNPTHQIKKLGSDSIREFRDRFNIPIPDEKLDELPFYKPDENSPAMRYLHERRNALGGSLPPPLRKSDEHFTIPPLEHFKPLLEPTAAGC